MGKKFVQLAFGCLMVYCGYIIFKIDCYVFSIMADMLRDGLELTCYNMTILIALLILFSIILLVLLFPVSCGLYLIGDVFEIDLSDK